MRKDSCGGVCSISKPPLEKKVQGKVDSRNMSIDRGTLRFPQCLSPNHLNQSKHTLRFCRLWNVTQRSLMLGLSHHTYIFRNLFAHTILVASTVLNVPPYRHPCLYWMSSRPRNLPDGTKRQSKGITPTARTPLRIQEGRTQKEGHRRLRSYF